MCLAKHCTTLQLLTQNAISSRKPLLTPACQWAPRGILCFTITALPALYRNHLFRRQDPWVRLKKIQEGKACSCSSWADVCAGEVAFLAGNEMTQAPRAPEANGRNRQLRQSRCPKRYRWSSLGCFILTLKTPRTEYGSWVGLLTPNLNKEFCLFLRKILCFSFRATFSSYQNVRRSIRRPCFLPPSKVPLWATFCGYTLYFYQGMLQGTVS